MLQTSLALYNWTNGVIMIGVFVAVCVILIITLISFVSKGKKKEDEEDL